MVKARKVERILAMTMLTIFVVAATAVYVWAANTYTVNELKWGESVRSTDGKEYSTALIGLKDDLSGTAVGWTFCIDIQTVPV